jgi:hypothetical protein
MKNPFVTVIALSIAILPLSACGGGGGGGGGSAAPPATTSKVVISAYLFGTMSSSTATVTTIEASMKVPSGVYAMYSSPAPAGYPANLFPLRSNAAVTSGKLANSAASISGTYNTQTGIVSLQLLNNPAANNSIATLQSSSTGSGNEFATLYFTLASPGTTVPFIPSDQALTYSVQQTDLSAQTSGVPAKGCQLKFSTTYQ